jgi:hypothetical protein
METKELSGCRHGTSKQHAPPRKSKKKSQNSEKKIQNNSRTFGKSWDAPGVMKHGWKIPTTWRFREDPLSWENFSVNQGF